MRIEDFDFSERIPKRFWAKIKKDASGCWLWTGAQYNNGYGQIIVRKDRKVIRLRTHRVAFALANGCVSDDLLVLHTCDVHLCCNPAHLFEGTNDDNMKDMREKGRAAKDLLGVTGDNHPSTKITDEEVLAIGLQNQGGESQRGIAKKYGISSGTINYIINTRLPRLLAQRGTPGRDVR